MARRGEAPADVRQQIVIVFLHYKPFPRQVCRATPLFCGLGTIMPMFTLTPLVLLLYLFLKISS